MITKLWKLQETEFFKENIEKNGSRFLIGNGYMGYRGTLEEFNKEQLVSLNMAGLFDKSGELWRESVNAPNPFYIKCSIGGVALDVRGENVVSHTELKYRAESPFGLCAPYTNCEQEQDAAVKLLGNLGISSMRLDKQNKNFHLSDCLKAEGITRQSIGIAYNKTQSDIDGYIKEVRELASDWLDRVEIFFMANEFDIQTKGNYSKSKKEIEERLIPYTFAPAYELFKNEFPDKMHKVVWESNCHGTVEWFEAFYEAGLWDKSEIIDVHSYSNPTGPDKVFTNTVENKFSSMYSIEYAAQRWERVCRRYGKKRLIVGETGYPTSVTTKVGINPRTVADFNVRAALFLLSAGAELINFFSTFDRVSVLVGTSTWRELYFGAFTNTDYFGTYMPPPMALAHICQSHGRRHMLILSADLTDSGNAPLRQNTMRTNSARCVCSM